MGTPVKSYLSPEVNLQNLLTILESSTTLGMVSEFLKRKELPSSAGSWVDMKSKRLEPALKAGTVFVGELVELLRTVEETGRQHILLFHVPPENLSDLFDLTKFTKRLDEAGMLELMEKPQFLLLPKTETIADIRFGSSSRAEHLVIKEYTTKTIYVKSGEFMSEGAFFKKYSPEESRSVNLVRIWKDGLIEVRIESRATNCDYADMAQKFLRRLLPIIDLTSASVYPLNHAKRYVWDNQESLKDTVALIDTTFKDATGGALRAMSSNNIGISEKKVILQSVNQMLDQDDSAYAEKGIFLFVGGGLSQPIVVDLTRKANEIHIPSRCSIESYDYAFTRILDFNAEVPK